MRLDKKYYIVKNKTSNGDAIEFADGTIFGGDTVHLLKMSIDKTVEPQGSSVIEYFDRQEAEVAAVSVVFTDYSNVDDATFVRSYERFTTNDKNIGRQIRQAITAWTAKNAASWTALNHQTIWPTYDNLLQRLSDGALLPAQQVLAFIPNTIDGIDMSSLNELLDDLLVSAFEKFPR